MVEHGWSRAVLTHHIETQLHKREGKAVINFQRTLPPPQADLAEYSLLVQNIRERDAVVADAQNDLQNGLVYGASRPSRDGNGFENGRAFGEHRGSGRDVLHREI